MYGKSNMEIYITICKTVNRNLLYGSGNSKQGLCINVEGWDGEGDGRGTCKPLKQHLPAATSVPVRCLIIAFSAAGSAPTQPRISPYRAA